MRQAETRQTGFSLEGNSGTPNTEDTDNNGSGCFHKAANRATLAGALNIQLSIILSRPCLDRSWREWKASVKELSRVCVPYKDLGQACAPKNSIRDNTGTES